MTCCICGDGALSEIAAYAALARVTSDSRPWPPGGRLAFCTACGAVQTSKTDMWVDEIDRIYGNYDLYHQSGGVEQAVFDAATGAPKRRSLLLIERLAAETQLADRGRALDVGCGRGAMLSAISSVLPGWRLWGQDLDTRSLRDLEAIPAFEQLYSGALSDIPGHYDLITMSHSLEHLIDPVDALKILAGKLAPGGRLFVQVPNVGENPFILVVADHFSHFTPTSLANSAIRAGVKIELLERTWTARELSMVVRAAPETGASPSVESANWAVNHVDWLSALAADASAAAKNGRFGIFGTSIGATWLSSGLSKAAFFVDEDPSRKGRTHMSQPILQPGDVDAGLTVLMPLTPIVASQVASRLAGLPVRWRLPPPFGHA